MTSRIAGQGRCWSPTPGRGSPQPDVVAQAGEGEGGRSLGPPAEPPDGKVWRVSREPIVSFRILREGVEKLDGNRIGCGVTQNWNLPESGGGRQCLFSRPASLGHIFGVVFPDSAFGTRLKHQHTQGTFPLSGLRRRDGRKSESSPPSAYSFCFFQIRMDDKTTRIRPLLAKSTPQASRHRWRRPDVAGVEMPKMEMEKGGPPWKERAQKAPASALAGGGPRSSATLLSLFPVVMLQRWGHEGTRSPEGFTRLGKNLLGH